MSTLLLRLRGPMQSWGTDSRFTRRFTELEPSKSGVVGLLCAALGKPRQEQPDDGFPTVAALARLRMGVRVDRPGTLQLDYHTAGGSHGREVKYGVATADGRLGHAVVSHRYYLADADFLVGLESDEVNLLQRIDAGLRQPVWALSLGRKTFVPSTPVCLPTAPPAGPSLRPEPLELALVTYPWPVPAPETLRLIVDTDLAEATAIRQDWPISFADRRFAPRATKTLFVRQSTGGV